MIEKKLTTAAIEATYELIADGIDRAGEARAQLFLAKLCLALANLVGDPAEITQAVGAALRDLD
jgi:ethanolamine utilization microcompartment shell protein EutL